MYENLFWLYATFSRSYVVSFVVVIIVTIVKCRTAHFGRLFRCLANEIEIEEGKKTVLLPFCYYGGIAFTYEYINTERLSIMNGYEVNRKEIQRKKGIQVKGMEWNSQTEQIKTIKRAE